ncbi:MAG: PHP-associated domain-containing protein [Gemmatimonadaceae bacterium]
MLIDLHCHTKIHSACSALTPDALVRAARARGIDGVCITEHDALWPLADIERLAEEMSFVVLRGMEVTTEVGHVLVYGAIQHSPEMSSLEALHRIVCDDGALMFLAHPSRRYGTLPPADLASVFDSVETQNGSEGILQNDNAAQLARTLRIPGIGGSDANCAREVAVCATRFDADIHDEPTFLTALRTGAYTATRI